MSPFLGSPPVADPGGIYKLTPTEALAGQTSRRTGVSADRLASPKPHVVRIIDTDGDGRTVEQTYLLQPVALDVSETARSHAMRGITRFMIAGATLAIGVAIGVQPETRPTLEAGWQVITTYFA